MRAFATGAGVNGKNSIHLNLLEMAKLERPNCFEACGLELEA
jgi:hypothetical protein